MKKVSILLPCYKSKELLEKVFWPSFSRSTLVYDCEVIFYDNGGNGNWDFIDIETLNAGLVKSIGNGKNIGLNAALNECAKVATGDYFYLPHTDMYMMPGCLENLLLAAKNQPPASFLLCSRSIEPTQGHTNHHIIRDYGMEAKDFSQEKLLADFEVYANSTIEVGARMPFFLHRKLWEKMKGVDENYFSYCTDDDLIQEAYHAGCRKFWMVYGSLVYHLQGKSNNQQKVDKDSNKPYEYFIDKWKKRGYNNAEHPAYMHPKMIPFYTKVK